jgi:hypothetical protein
MTFEKIEKNSTIEKKNLSEKLKQKLIPLIFSVLILSNPALKDFNKLFSKTISIVKNLFIQTAYAEKLTREQLENIENSEKISIESIS